MPFFVIRAFDSLESLDLVFKALSFPVWQQRSAQARARMAAYVFLGQKPNNSGAFAMVWGSTLQFVEKSCRLYLI